MGSIFDIYKRYNIMPSLAEHQIKVASVADLISSYFSDRLDKRDVVLACLFHDMGNIIKSDLNKFPDFLKPEGLEYWQKIKSNFIEKYGEDVHVATVNISKELNLPANALKIIENFGFSNIKNIYDNGTLEQKICSYSDMRVGPLGVISLKERVEDLRKRYGGVIVEKYSSESFDDISKSLFKLEEEIFSKIPIKPKDIDEESILGIKEALKKVIF